VFFSQYIWCMTSLSKAKRKSQTNKRDTLVSLVCACVADEIVISLLLFLVCRNEVETGYVLRGQSAKAGVLSCNSCCICLQGEAESAEILENYCDTETHLAHPQCLTNWYIKGPSYSKTLCPLCRRDLLVRQITSSKNPVETSLLKVQRIVMQADWRGLPRRWFICFLSYFVSRYVLMRRISTKTRRK
jgi:hypothetical protein